MSEKGIFFMLSLSEILILSNSEIYDWLQTAPFGFRMEHIDFQGSWDF